MRTCDFLACARKRTHIVVGVVVEGRGHFTPAGRAFGPVTIATVIVSHCPCPPEPTPHSGIATPLLNCLNVFGAHSSG